LGDKRAETNSAPFVIPHTFSPTRLDRVQQNAETNYGHSVACINQEEQVRQYQDDVSVLIIFRFLQVPLAGWFTGRKVFRSNEISVLSLLPFYLQQKTSKEGQLSYPNFVRGPLLGSMQLSFDHFEVLGTHR